MIPVLRMIRSQLNTQLASQFGPEWCLDYDISDVEALREDYSKKLDEAAKLFALGVPFNKIDEMLGLGVGAIEGGDVGYLQSSLLPTNLDFGGEAKGELPNDIAKLLAYGKD
jgi:hypothetical protein